MLKKLYLFLIILICFFIISAVSATENTTSDILSMEESSDEFISVDVNHVNETAKTSANSIIIEENNKVGVTEENELGAYDGTFSDLARKIVYANGTLDLTMDYKYTIGVDDDYKDGIPIDFYQKTITINGNGHTIDGKGQGRGFVNYGTWGVVLKNINFININGGAVYSTRFSGNWILSDCSFVNCYGDEGAVTFRGANSTLSYCSFVNCSGDEGAVYWNVDNSTLSRCKFIDCSAKYGGGAVQCKGENSTLSRCTFENCYARYGGAVYCSGDNSILSNCVFKNCSALNTGGAVYCSGDNSILSSCTFTKCFSGSQGGAIYWKTKNGVLSDCFFGNCHSNFSSGGAVYCENINGVLSSCTFTLCGAKEQGGAVNWKGANCTLYDCHFYTCFSNSSGGAVYGEGDNSKLSNCVFTYCSSDGSGGAVSWNGGECSFSEFDFQNCYSKWYGGGIYIGGVNCSLSNSSFQDCTANKEGSWYYSPNPLNVTINKISTAITAQDVTTTYGVPKNLVVTLTDIDNNFLSGEEISIELNNYKYSLKTNSNGEISFDIPTDLIPKTYVVTIRYLGNDMYSSSSTTVRVVVNKLATKNTLSYTKNSHNSFTLTALINSSTASGDVVFTVNGKDYPAKVNGGKATYTLNNLAVGSYSAVAKYAGDVNHKESSSNSVKFTVEDVKIDINVHDVTKDYGGPENLEITLTDSGSPIANAQVKININNKDYIRTTDSNGKASLELNLNAGTYDATVTYKDISTVAKVTINQLATTTTISYNKNSRNSVTLTALVNPSTAGGNVVFTVNGKDYSADKLSGGKATHTLSNLAVGNYEAKATYQGDVNHKSSASSSVKFTVDESNIELKVPDVTKNYGGSENLEITLTEDGSPIANAKINININGGDYTRTTDSNGKTSMPINLNAGSYDAVVSYEDVSATAKVTVNQLTTKTSLAYTKNSLNSVTLTASVNPSSAGGKVTFNVNGKDYIATVSDAKATYTLNNLAVGSYNAKATYDGDINYKSSSSDNVKFTVEEHSIIVSAPDVTKYYGGDERFVVTVTDNDGNPVANEPVKVTINGQVYDRKTGADGRTTFAINLRSGIHEATTEHDGEVIKSTITVKTTVISKDITKIFRNGTNYEASFLDKKGNKAPAGEKVSININGVFYHRTIKSDGSISFALNLEQGTYVLTLTNPYTGEEISNTVTILPNIVDNKDLVKYYRNGSQFTFKLLDDKGNPVAGQKASININGVFYTRTTNDKGIATFQINLEPGTYILTMEYKGCRVSNKVTVLSVIKSSDIKMKYQDGTRFKVTILDGVGKPYANQSVTFNINGVFYYRVTGTDGSASLAINLMAGEYIITSTYNSLNVSNKVTISG